MLYGILKSATNTGIDSELSVVFAAPLSVLSNRDEKVADTINLRRFVSHSTAQRWEIEANCVPSKNSNFLVQSVVSGLHSPLWVRMPQVFSNAAKIPLTRTLTVASNSPAFASTVSISGMNQGDVLLAGEFVNFGFDTKVYMLTQECTYGDVMHITPTLRSAVTAGMGIAFGGRTRLRARLDSGTVVGMRYRDGVLSDPGAVKFVEAL
jgi:hypothetical protein